MRLLVFGRTGQVARELARRAPGAAYLDRDAADLTDPDACAARIAEAEVDAVINAAAWTGVDAAENDEATATIVNGRTPGAMARAAAARDLPFVHISTDYVFDGAGGRPFAPDDPTGPLGAYGRTKLAGEAGVLAARGRAVMLRTSWVFSAHGGNFVKTMLRLGRERHRINVVADQVGGPTPAGAIAMACLTIADRLGRDADLAGTYHFSGMPEVSWAEFARAIFDRAALDVVVEDIATEDYPTASARPRNSRLDCGTTEAAFGLARPDWRPALDEVLTELAETAS